MVSCKTSDTGTPFACGCLMMRADAADDGAAQDSTAATTDGAACRRRFLYFTARGKKKMVKAILNEKSRGE